MSRFFRDYVTTFATPFVALVVAGFIAFGCTNTSKLTPQSVVTTAQQVAQGLLSSIQQIKVSQPTLIPPATEAKIENDLNLAIASANSLSANLPAEAGAAVVQKVEAYLNSVLLTISSPPINGVIPPPYNEMVAAANILVPQLEIFVNQYIPSSTPPTAGAVSPRLAALSPGMTPDKANAVAAKWSAGGK